MYFLPAAAEATKYFQDILDQFVDQEHYLDGPWRQLGSAAPTGYDLHKDYSKPSFWQVPLAFNSYAEGCTRSTLHDTSLCPGRDTEWPVETN